MTIAIDPGKSGGIAYRDTDGSVHAVPMPDTVADLDRLLRVLVCRREPFYRRLAEADPTQNRFLQGWLNRVEKLKTTSGIA